MLAHREAAQDRVMAAVAAVSVRRGLYVDIVQNITSFLLPTSQRLLSDNITRVTSYVIPLLCLDRTEDGHFVDLNAANELKQSIAIINPGLNRLSWDRPPKMIRFSAPAPKFVAEEEKDERAHSLPHM
jgi:hypothetical protein